MYENDFLDDSDFNIEEFLKTNFIKFTIQIHKWSKDINDTYLVDFAHIKSGITCIFYD